MALKAGMEAVETGKRSGRYSSAAESTVLLNGGQLSFVSEFGSGSRTQLVAPLPTNKVLKEGDLCLLDMGGAYQGYRGDITRMKVAGKPTKTQRELLEFEAENLKQTIAAIRPGMKCSELHRIGKKAIQEAGYEKHGGWTASGHGNGLEMHEYPALDETSDVRLEKNMILCVEPSFTVPEGTFRLEDMVLVTEGGCETLTKCRMDWWMS